MSHKIVRHGHTQKKCTVTKLKTHLGGQCWRDDGVAAFLLRRAARLEKQLVHDGEAERERLAGARRSRSRDVFAP